MKSEVLRKRRSTYGYTTSRSDRAGAHSVSKRQPINPAPNSGEVPLNSIRAVRAAMPLQKADHVPVLQRSGRPALSTDDADHHGGEARPETVVKPGRRRMRARRPRDVVMTIQ